MAQIDKPNLHFRTKLFIGNQTARSITFDESSNMQPDLVWIKPRDNGSWSNNITDSVRGAGKGIFSDLNNTEYDYGTGTNGSVRTFDTNGFSIGTATQVNNNSSNIVAWTWKAGGAGSANTDGSINSTVSVNTTAGFSIVSYTGNGSAGATIGHGLGATPAVIIQKIRSSSGNWIVYHHKNTSAPETDFLKLNTTAATADEVTIFNDTAPTNSVFSVGTESTINGNNNTCVAYCFAEKKGYSKFGSYTGNGNSDGTFVYTGFKPAFLITKRTNSASSGDWNIVDSARNPSNVVGKYLHTNLSNAEGTASIYDILSNGFKIRESGAGTNASGSTYIYLAFAENPIVGSNNVPTVAR